MIRQDIQNGEGVAVIDPHGELVEEHLEFHVPHAPSLAVKRSPTLNVSPTLHVGSPS